MIFLDANDSNQVYCARTIEAELSNPNQKMLVCSGIARPQFKVNDDGHIYRETAVVNLRRTVLAIEQYTVSIGLSSIGNDDTLFLIAADATAIDVDPVSQEVILKVDMALEGESTFVERFGYQVVMVVTTQTTGISGSIRWNKSLFNGDSLTAGTLAKTFRITANLKTTIIPDGPNSFAFDKLTPVASGFTKGISKDTHDFIVPYEIPSAPYNQSLYVIVEIGTFFSAPSVVAGQISGPEPVVLTVTHPGVSSVDFRITQNLVR